MGNSEAKQFFLKTDYAQFWEDRLATGYEEPHLLAFIKSLELNNTQTVLEIGSGGGRILARISPLVRRCVGVDISKKAMKVGAIRRALPANVDLVVADGSKLPFADSTFDRSFSFSTLFFIPDQTSAIRENARVSRHSTIEFVNRMSIEGLSAFAETVGSIALKIMQRTAGGEATIRLTSLILGPTRAKRVTAYVEQGVRHSQFPMWIWTPIVCLKRSKMKITSIEGTHKRLPWWFSPKIVIHSDKIPAESGA